MPQISNAKGPPDEEKVDDDEIDEDDPIAAKHDTIGNPGFYTDQNGLRRWRITAGEGEVLASASRGFNTEEEAQADYDEQVANNTLPALKVFQPKNGPTGYQFGSGGDTEQVVGNDAVAQAKQDELDAERNPPAQQNAKPDLGVATGKAGKKS